MLEPLSETDLTNERHRALYDYWSRRIGSTGLPLARDFDLDGVPDLARSIGMVSVVREASRLRFRHDYTGNEIVQRIRRDPTGLWFEEVYSGDHLRKAHVTYVQVAALKRPMFSRDAIADDRGKLLIYDRLILPLGGNDHLVDQIVYQPVFLEFEKKNPSDPDRRGMQGRFGSVAAE